MPLTAAIKRLGPWAILEYVANPALSLALTPLIIHHLGLAGFGEWVLIATAATLPVSLSAGISTALARHLAANQADPIDVLRRIQVDALVATLAASVLGALALVAWLTLWNVHSSAESSHKWLLGTFMACIVIADCLDSTLTGVLRGNLRYAESARVEVIARIAQYCLMLIALAAVPSITTLAAATFIGSGMRALLRGRLCHLTWINWEKIRLTNATTKSPLSQMAFWATVQSLAGTLYTSLDRLVISAAFGPITLGIYAATSQLTNQIQAVLGAAFSVISNATASEHLLIDQASLKRDVFRLSCLIAGSAMVAYLAFYAIAEQLFSAWLGTATMTRLSPLIPAVIVAATSQTIVMPAHFYLLGDGRFKAVAGLGLLAGVTSISLLWISSQFLPPSQALFSRTAYGLVLCSYFFVIYRMHAHRVAPNP
jgi:O-antigen/teichoic acid export membrane protein